MDYEGIVLGLQNILDLKDVNELAVKDEHLQDCISVLNQLAVYLRLEANRNLIRENGLLDRLIVKTELILEGLFGRKNDTEGLVKVSSELIRCVANSFVDNDDNREVCIDNQVTGGNRMLGYYSGKILQLNLEEAFVSELQFRTIAMVQNFCLRSDENLSRCTKQVMGPLLDVLRQHESVFPKEEYKSGMHLGLGLLVDMVEKQPDGVKIGDMEMLVRLAERVARELTGQDGGEAGDAEAGGGLDEDLANLSNTLETSLNKNEALVVTEPSKFSTLQCGLLNTLEELSEKTFANKLIVMRSLVSSIGYLSANACNSNVDDREMCYGIIKKSNNQYTICACLFILSNSISNRLDVNEVLEHVSLLELLDCTEHFKDPFVYQSLLDIFKKCLNLSSIIKLPKSSYPRLFHFLRNCKDHSRYYYSLSCLLDSILNKVLVTFNGADLTTEPVLLDIVTELGGIPACLLLDKFSKQRQKVSQEMFDRLLSSVFKFSDSKSTDSSVSTQHLFHMFKSIGIYVYDSKPHELDLLLQEFDVKLKMLLESIKQLRDKADSGSQSVVNNAKFTACVVLKHITKLPQGNTDSSRYHKLITLCRDVMSIGITVNDTTDSSY